MVFGFFKDKTAENCATPAGAAAYDGKYAELWPYLSFTDYCLGTIEENKDQPNSYLRWLKSIFGEDFPFKQHLAEWYALGGHIKPHKWARAEPTPMAEREMDEEVYQHFVNSFEERIASMFDNDQSRAWLFDFAAYLDTVSSNEDPHGTSILRRV
jgi:hypothetical protein